MLETISITCPECKTVLIVDKKTGQIIEKRKPILEESCGDRFEDAFKKVKQSAERADAKFKEAQDKRNERLKNLDQFFKDSVKKAKEEGETPQKPASPFDLE